MKLTPGPRAILERLARHDCLLVLAITGHGGRSRSQLSALVQAGYARLFDHPSVDEPGKYQAFTVSITEAGRNALSERSPK